MLKIVICDDEVIFTETMKEALAREFGLHGLQCEYSCYTDGKNLLQKVGQTERTGSLPGSDLSGYFHAGNHWNGCGKETEGEKTESENCICNCV